MHSFRCTDKMDKNIRKSTKNVNPIILFLSFENLPPISCNLEHQNKEIIWISDSQFGSFINY